MSGDLYVPLSDIIARAASAPAEGKAAQLKRRFDNATDQVVVVADCSGSMEDLIGSAGMTKHQHLQVALKDIRQAFPRIRVVTLGGYVRELKPNESLPAPAGGTPLTRALQHVAEWKPRKTIVISDGLPDDQPSAVEVAKNMTGAIDTIYCGPDGHPAIDFLRQLAKDTGGREVQWDGCRELSNSIRGLLGPA